MTYSVLPITVDNGRRTIGYKILCDQTGERMVTHFTNEYGSNSAAKEAAQDSARWYIKGCHAA